MAQNPKQITENNGAGNMQLSQDPRRITYPNYGEAKGITWFTNESGEGFTVKPVVGNSYSFEIPDAVAQNIIYKITDNESGDDYSIDIFDMQSNSVVSVVTSTGWDDFKDAVVNALNSIYYFAYTFTDLGTYFTLELYDILYYPYKVVTTGATALITQEAIDDWAAGKHIIIGAQQVLDRTFLYTTTIEKPIPEITINGFFDFNGNVGLDVAIPPSLVTSAHFLVKVTGSTASGGTADGIWMADATLTMQGIVLNNSVYDASLTTGTLFIGLIGFGQIGVLQQGNSVDTYTRLLASTELRWTAFKQIDSDGEPFTATKDVMYPTDNNNPPSVFYFPRPFVQDGGLTINGGQYDYGTVADESLVWQHNGARIAFKEQLDTGGGLDGGVSWRYTVCFVTDSGTETECLPLTNPCPVFKASNASSNKILGDNTVITTSKINVVTVSNIEANIFKYVVLKAVKYVGAQSVQGYRVKQVLINGATTLDLTHTGLEQATEDLDVGEILFAGAGAIYNTARNVRLINDNLIYSNLTAQEIDDYSDFAKTLRHRIMSKSLDFTGTNARGFQDPANCVKYTGYMANETYRFGAVMRRRDTGQFLPLAFWVDDICVDTNQTTNIGNVDTPPDNRRDAGDFTEYNFTDDPTTVIPTEVITPYVEFAGGDMNFLINGVPIKKLISEIWVVRAECIPEILGMGLALRTRATGYGDYSNPNITGTNISTVIGTLFGVVDNLTIPPIDNSTDLYKYFFSFYTPDEFMSKLVLPNSAYFLNLGDVRQTDYQYNYTGNGFFSDYVVYNGYTGNSTIGQTATLDSLALCDSGDAIYISGNTFSNHSFINVPGNLMWSEFRCIVAHSDDVIDNTSNYTSYTTRFGQIFNDLGRGAKYGEKTDNLYLFTNAVISLDDVTTSQIQYGQLQVFGGDTTTGRVVLKNNQIDFKPNTSGPTDYNTAIRYFTQSRVNAHLRSSSYDGQLLFPQNNPVDSWIASEQIEDFSYNDAYSVFGSNAIDYKHAYDANIETITNESTTIIWSNQRQRGSLVDDHRIFPPLQFNIQEFKHGDINHMEEQNGELITFQPDAIKRQFFNTNNVLVTKDSTEVLMGNSAPLRANPDKRTLFGSYHKWGCGKGVSAGGKDVLYSIDTGNKIIIRQGADGTVPISDVHFIGEWFKDHISYAHLYDTPAYNAGIHFVWDSQNKWAIWVIKGFSMNPDEWDAEISYAQGDYTKYNGDIYIWTQVNYTAVRPDLRLVITENGWQKVEPDVKYSIVFDENNNGFKCFMPPTPKIFFKLLDRYFSPDYLSGNTNKAYVHNFGDILSWYEGVLQEPGYISFVDNINPGTLKKYTNLVSNSLVKPYQIDMSNETQTATILAVNFSGIKQLWAASVGNDASNSAMIDTYMIFKFYFEPLVRQILVSLYTKKTSLSPNIKQ